MCSAILQRHLASTLSLSELEMAQQAGGWQRPLVDESSGEGWTKLKELTVSVPLDAGDAKGRPQLTPTAVSDYDFGSPMGGESGWGFTVDTSGQPSIAASLR